MPHDCETILSRVVAHLELAQFGGGGISSSQLVMLALAIGGLSVVMVSTRRRIRESRALSRPRARDQYSSSRQQVAKRDLEAVMLELDQLSRQIHGRIDTKLARLEILLRDADERIEALSALQQASDPPDRKPPDRSRAVGTANLSATHKSKDDTRASVIRLAQSGRSSVEIAKAVGRTPGEVELMIALGDVQTR